MVKRYKLWKILLFAALICVSIGLLAMGGRQSVRAEGKTPYLYFGFDETDANGDYYEEIGGEAAVTHGTPAETEGRYGGHALSFDGTAWMELNTWTPLTGNVPHTMMAWVKLDLDKYTQTNEPVVCGFGQYAQGCDSRIAIWQRNAIVSCFGTLAGQPVNEEMREWTHLAATYDGSIYRFYINGAAAGATSDVSTLVNIVADHFYIGGFNGGMNPFFGTIDEVYLFDSALTDAEVGVYMRGEGEFERSAPKAEPHTPYLYFGFDKTDANGNYYDGIGGNAALTNGTPAETEGRFGGHALSFDGSASLELNSWTPLTGNVPHTMMAWVKLDLDKYTSSNEPVVCGFGQYYPWSDSRIVIWQRNVVVSSNGTLASTPLTAAMADWTHIVSVYDGSRFSLYLNGVHIASTDNVGDSVNIVEESFYIGGFNGGMNPFFGEIDEVYLFDSALGQKEIEKYMNNNGEFEQVQPNDRIPHTDEEIAFEELAVGWNNLKWKWNGTTVAFSLYVPETYRADGKNPFLVFLHGDGSNGSTPEQIRGGGEAVTVQRAVSETDAVILVPAATSPWITVPNDRNVVYPYRSYDMREAVPSQELLTVVRLIAYLTENMQTDPDRCYYAGYSRGTMAGWWLLGNYPERFTAAILCCGAGDPAWTDRFPEIPVWLFQDSGDPLVSAEDIRAIAAKIEERDGLIRYTETTGLGHDLRTAMEGEEHLMDWLFSFRKSELTAPTDPEPTDPEPTDPEPTDPEPTDPEPTDPEPTDPTPTDPTPDEQGTESKDGVFKAGIAMIVAGGVLLLAGGVLIILAIKRKRT